MRTHLHTARIVGRITEPNRTTKKTTKCHKRCSHSTCIRTNQTREGVRGGKSGKRERGERERGGRGEGGRGRERESERDIYIYREREGEGERGEGGKGERVAERDI